jgi:hypothetical protein
VGGGADGAAPPQSKPKRPAKGKAGEPGEP